MTPVSADGTVLHVLVLAAGLGTRLRPLTLEMPKPLVPLVDAPTLAHQARLAAGLGKVLLHVNAHWLAERIVQEAPAMGFGRVWVEEPEILGTGGPIQRMWSEGVRGELLVLNGDCYTNPDLAGFVERSRASGASCALLARRFAKVDTLRITKNGHLSGIANRFGPVDDAQHATFTGISWYSADAWSAIRSTERDVREFWKRLVDEGKAPRVEIADDGLPWIDMGDPEGLWNAVQCRLSELDTQAQNGNWVEPGHTLARSVPASWRHSVVHAGADVDATAVLIDSVLLPGAQVGAHETVVREIRAKDIAWKIAKQL